MPHSIRGLSAASLSVLLQSGHLDPVALLDATFDAVAAADPAIFTALSPERAQREAEAARRRIAEGRSLGLLDGIPLAWKDLFDMAGMATAAGSALLRHAPPAEADAPVVAALAAAGMVAVGRTNMSEFAFSGLGLNPHYGTPENPRATDAPRVTGGSSSGAAAAVATGLVPVAIGSDTGGSVRIPAAFCGLVGYKASRGRYPMAGVFPLSTSLDTLGPLTRTVQDAIWVDAAMRGKTAPTVERSQLAGKTLIVPTSVVFDGAEPGVIAAFEAGLARLGAAGARIERRPFPLFDEVLALGARHGALVTAEAYALHQARLESHAGAMDPRVASRVALGSRIAIADYIALLSARQRMVAAFAEEIGPDSLLVHPTVAHVAPKIAPLIADDEAFVATNIRTLRNTMLTNFLDGCGVSLPCGQGEAGLPVGLLLSAPHGEDERLLSTALAAESLLMES
ncbi:amidase [Rhizobium sp. YIM 134829]|uniref:amidase n=1 Tax=Rhizobium sp. YIM 134829 TaxID=3390453 RepID=UPI003979B0A2